MKKSPPLLLDIGVKVRDALNVWDIFEAISMEGTTVIGATS
jgi:hypothetical protein